MTLIDQGLGCIPVDGGQFATLPDASIILAAGLQPYALLEEVTGGGKTQQVSADSNQIPVGTGPAWHNLQIAWQAHRVNLPAGAIVSSSNVFKQTMRFNDGL